jgi:hypothetical protein
MSQVNLTRHSAQSPHLTMRCYCITLYLFIYLSIYLFIPTLYQSFVIDLGMLLSTVAQDSRAIFR